MICTSSSQPKETSCDRDHRAVAYEDESATVARHVSRAQRWRADGMTEDWTGRYAACAADISGSAARAPLTLTGFSACVDAVYTVDARMLDTLTHVASRDHTGMAATKPRHYILEFTAGTRWSAGVVARSTRIILRFAYDGVERDEAFAKLTPRLAPTAGAGLVSGMNGVRPGDERDEYWVIDLARQWRKSGLPLIHLELAEYPVDRQLADVCKQYAGVASSIGMSLSELRAMTRSSVDPAELALGVAQLGSVDRVCIHADTWSMSV